MAVLPLAVVLADRAEKPTAVLPAPVVLLQERSRTTGGIEAASGVAIESECSIGRVLAAGIIIE